MLKLGLVIPVNILANPFLAHAAIAAAVSELNCRTIPNWS